MFVSGLTVRGEDICFEEAIQEFIGDPAQKVVQEHKLKMEEKRRLASLAYQNFIGPETRQYQNLQLGALAAYLIRRGLDDREVQAKRAHELVNNTLSAVMTNGRIELTLQTTEHLTIAAAQNRGIRLVDGDLAEGTNDPVYDAIISSELDPVVYITEHDETNARIYDFTLRTDRFNYSSLGAVAGS
jgi:hypothetical protein